MSGWRFSAGDRHFKALYDGLMNGPLDSAFEVAEACLRYATLCTDAGYVFDSARWRELDVVAQLQDHIGMDLGAPIHPDKLKAIAKTIKESKEPPLAAWCTAMLISIACSQNFSPDSGTPSEYELQDLQAFPIPAKGCNTLYGGATTGLSTQPGPDRSQNDPSAVSGLALWLKSRTRPYKVVIDRVGGDQLNACLDENNTLKIALIQPNKYLLDFCVATLSSASDPNPRFFGLQPRNEQAQTSIAVNGLKAAAKAGAGIAMLPELTMTESTVNQIGTDLATPGKIIPQNADHRTLRMVVSGSFHHTDCHGAQRNSARAHFPRHPDPSTYQQHSKSGVFYHKIARLFLEMMSRDQKVADTALKAWQANPVATLTEVKFQEDIEYSYEIRLFIGSKISAVVVICADVLSETFRNVLKEICPSLVLVCNMTGKLRDFENAAGELILACQATLVSVNNPGEWFGKAVPGVLVAMPLGDGVSAVRKRNFKNAQQIIIFDFGRATKDRPAPKFIKRST
jgi:hypothetical protein